MSLWSRRHWSMVIPALLVAVTGVAGTSWWFCSRIDVPALLQEVEAAIARKDFEAATQVVDRVLRHDPRNVAANLKRGRVSAAQRQWEEGLEFFDRVADSALQGAEARHYEGLVYREMQRARQAEQAFLKALALNPDPGVPGLAAHENLSRLYASQLRVEPMRRHLNAVLSFRPWTLDEFVWFVTGGVTWGMPAQRAWQMRSYWDTDPVDIDSALALAQTNLSFENSAEAEAVLRRLLVDFPGDARVHALLAESLMLRNDLAGAAEALSFAPTETPAVLWLSRGQYAALTGEWQEAAEFLGEAARLEPNSILACYRLGRALQQCGRTEDA